MKKLISAVLVLALVMAMSVSVFAVSERQKYIDDIEKDFEDLFEGDVAWENVWTVLQTCSQTSLISSQAIWAVHR